MICIAAVCFISCAWACLGFPCVFVYSVASSLNPFWLDAGAGGRGLRGKGVTLAWGRGDMGLQSCWASQSRDMSAEPVPMEG